MTRTRCFSLLSLTALVALFLSIPVHSADRGLTIAAWRSFPVGGFPNIGPKSIVAGDLNGDGAMDAVVGLWYFGGPGISVLMGRGEGTFAPPVVYETGYNFAVSEVALADVDADGDLDVLASIPDIFWSSLKLALWRNEGDGTLAAREDFAAGVGPMGLVVGDFTGDGFPDVVTSDYDWLGSGDTVSLIPHNGRSGPQAGFEAPVAYFCGESPVELDAADLDGDGDLDLVVGREETGNAVLLNEGGGVFATPSFYPQTVGSNLHTDSIELADVDQDGDVDLLAAGMDNGSPSYGLVALRRNAGAGVFGPPEEFRLADWSFTPASLTAGDINGDGYPDVVATTPSGRSMDGFDVLLNDASGGFLASRHYEAAKWTEGAELFDTDSDGDLDIITVANDSAVITVHENPGDGDLAVLPRNLVGSLTGGLWTRGMDSADIDNDGDLDVVTASGPAYILRNRGDGSFDPADVYDDSFGWSDVKLRDMDADGFADLLLNSVTSFSVALNLGDGTFGPAVTTFVGTSQDGETDAYDLDGDGLLDVVKVDSGPAAEIVLARNNGTGTSFTLMLALKGSGIPIGIDGADLDHDGNMDLVADSASGLSSFLGRGDFTFDDFIATGVFSSGGRFLLSDLDLDGNQDLVVMDANVEGRTSRVATMPGYGDGAFGFPNRYDGPIGLESAFRISSDIDTGDLDGDGYLDVVMTNNASNDLSVFLGQGDGTLVAEERYGSGYSSSASVVGDFTGDGLEDVATVMSLPPGGFQDAVVLLTGRGRIRLDVSGDCPGSIAVSAEWVVPGARVGFLAATGPGSIAVPEGRPCAGTTLSLAPSLRLLGSAVTDAGGVATLETEVPAAACGLARVQAIELDSCRTSQIERF